MRTHRQEIRNVRLHGRSWKLVAHDRVALLASLTGGLGSSISWATLLHGASLFPFATMDKGFVGLAEALTDQRITVLPSTASFFRAFVKSLDDRTAFPRNPGRQVGIGIGYVRGFQSVSSAFSRNLASRPDIRLVGNRHRRSPAPGSRRQRPPTAVCRSAGRVTKSKSNLLDERGAKVAAGEIRRDRRARPALCARATGETRQQQQRNSPKPRPGAAFVSSIPAISRV